MMNRVKFGILLLMLFVTLFALSACGADKEPQSVEADLSLAVGDTYNWTVMGYTALSVEGDAFTLSDGVITAVKAGTGKVNLSTEGGAPVTKTVEVFKNTQALGGKFSLDKGMFYGKDCIVFGDSITDYYVYPDKQTYFVRLCEYLGVRSNPFDTENVNIAAASTCVSYGAGDVFPTGVERVTLMDFTDDRGHRIVYENVVNAELCVIHYGANDINGCVALRTEVEGDPYYTDEPTKAERAVTIKGGYYFMVAWLRMINPNLKILLLPPTYRTCSIGDSNYEYTEDMNDAFSHAGGYYLSDVGKAVAEVGESLGAKTVDWFNVFNYNTFRVGGPNTDDGIHPSEEGHEIMFNYLIEHAAD